jgi:hypothetical protein
MKHELKNDDETIDQFIQRAMIHNYVENTQNENVEIRITHLFNDTYNVFVTFSIREFFYVEQHVIRYFEIHHDFVSIDFQNAYSLREIRQFDTRVNNYKMYVNNKRTK